MAALGDVAGDRDVVGLVSKEESGDFAVAHHALEGLRIGRVGADDAMRPQLEDIAEPRDRRGGGLRLERPLLRSLGPLAEKDLVDLVESESRHLDRPIRHNELLELKLQGVEIPLAFLAQAVHRQPEHALLLRVQVIDANARDALKSQLPRRRVADLAAKKFISATDEEWIAEAERRDRRGDLPDVRGVELAELSQRRANLVERQIDQVEPGQHVVASGPSDRCLRQAGLSAPALAALPAQLLRQRQRQLEGIEVFGHRWARALLLVVGLGPRRDRAPPHPRTHWPVVPDIPPVVGQRSSPALPYPGHHFR